MIFKNLNKYNSLFLKIFIALFIIVFSYFFTRKLNYLIGNNITNAILIFLLIFIISKYERLRNLTKYAAIGFIYFLLLLSIYKIFLIIKLNFINPHEWDFLCFYLYGKIAALGQNFYDPQYYKELLNNLVLPIPNLGSDFINGPLAFQYFPPNIFYFLPLGIFNFNTAHIIWTATNIIFLLAEAYLVYNIFSKEKKLMYLLAIIIIFLLLPGTQSAMYFEHNTFIFMLPLLLTWKYKDRISSGIWYSIGIFSKPFLLIILLYPLIRRQWKIISVTVVTSIIILLTTLIVFGNSIFISFLTTNPNSQLPNSDYTEWVNQSLLATILRLTHYDFTYSSPILHPLYIILGAVFLISTIILSYKLKPIKNDWTFSLILLMSLIIYPGTIYSYSPVVIPILLFLFYQRSLIFNSLGISIVFALVYFIMETNPFISYLFLWLLTSIIIILNRKKWGNGKILEGQTKLADSN